MPRKLKVFRTSIGFHDAYVAAASRKAALEAWGATANLFARGMAEEVSDPAFTEEPLSRPGEVIRKARGTAADHFAALPDAPSKSHGGRNAKAVSHPPASPAKSKQRPVPKPSRKKLDAAMEAVRQAEITHAEQRRDLEQREAELRRARQALETEYDRRMKTLEDKRSAAEADYARAIARWRELQRSISLPW